MRRKCEACGAEFDASAKARFCTGKVCVRTRERDKKRAQRAARGGSVTELAQRPAPLGGEVLRAQVAASAGAGRVEAATLATLEAAGRLETPGGAAAVALARDIDSPDTLPSARAGLVKELRATLAEALRGAQVTADSVDELRRHREMRRARGA